MPVLKNQRWEIFCQGCAKGLTNEQAYSEAGYRPHSGNAATLRGKKPISERIADIQSEALRQATKNRVVTLDTVHAELEKNLRLG